MTTFFSTTSQREYRLLCAPSDSPLILGSDAGEEADELCRSVTTSGIEGNPKNAGDWMLAKISNDAELKAVGTLTDSFAAVNYCSGFNPYSEPSPRAWIGLGDGATEVTPSPYNHRTHSIHLVPVSVSLQYRLNRKLGHALMQNLASVR